MHNRSVVRAWILIGLAATWPAHSQPAGPPGEMLTLERALALALESNRDLKSAHLEAAKAEDRMAATRTKRFPALQWAALGMQRLVPLYFTFPANAFGPSIPATDTSIRAPLQPGALLIGSLVQPLSQQYKIGLSLDVLKADRDLAVEQARGDRQSYHRIVRLH